jgi:urease accessory protein
MPDLTLIQKLPDTQAFHSHRQVRLQAERSILAKRRWRGVASDGREFGFDLDATLTDGTAFFIEGNTCYVIEQLPEPLLEVTVSSVPEAARIGWSLGNLHFGLEVRPHCIRVAPDPAVAQFLAREHLHYHEVKAVFRPLSAVAHRHEPPAHSHGHAH